MHVEHYVGQVQIQLAAAAALGDESTRATADALTAATEPAVRLAVLGAVSAAADEVTAALLDFPGAPAVSVRLDGEDLRIEVRASEPDGREARTSGVGADDVDNTARISLRLPDALKGRIDAAARESGVSVNTWILQAVSSVLSGSGGRGRRSASWEQGSGHRVTGWVNG